jgi:hypothetical protein
MAFAAADTVSVEAMHTGAGDMMSRIFLVMVTSWDGLVRYPLPCCANSTDPAVDRTGQLASLASRFPASPRPCLELVKSDHGSSVLASLARMVTMVNWPGFRPGSLRMTSA